MPNTGTVDERIVEMRIDHQKFEAGAKKTISILEKLDNSLSSLGNKNSDGLDQITNSLDKVTNKFSVMGTIGDQVIRNLTNKTMELISQMTSLGKELTVDQVGAGWSKYADKTSAVQTIMAATAKDFEDQAKQMEAVNEQLDKLNWFTDETSYNFLDMVGNIGKFTANGRNLEESVTAMQGIANWAAISGGRVQQASQAMYNLSQALGVGAVTQMDWKSIENANMATYEFKQQVIETAEEMGNLVKVGEGIWQIADGLEGAGHEVTIEGFRENLRYKWFDSDVLLKVLNTYGQFVNVLKDVSDATERTATEILQQIDSYEKTGQVAEWILPYIDELTKSEYDLGRRSFQAAQEAKTFAEAIDATKDAVSTKWMDIFETMFGDYMSAKGFWTQVSNSLWDIFAGPLDNLLTIVEKAFGDGGISGTVKKAQVSISDFEKAFSKVDSNKLRELVDSYGSLDEAIASGAVDAETYQKVINKTVPTLTEKLKAAGYSVDDFQRSFAKIAGNEYSMVIAQIGTEFESFDDAVRQGAISVDLFRQIMDDLTGSADQTEAAVSASGEAVIHSLEDMVQVANDVWAGVYGNGEERKQQLEELGYDYEMIQWIAGNINAMPWLNSAEGVAQLMAEFRPDLLTEVGEAAGLTEEEIAELAASIGDADALYAILTGDVTLASEALQEMTGKDYFTGGLLNILQFFADLGEVAQNTMSVLLGGSDGVSEKIYGMLQRFYEFTEAIQFVRDESGEIVSSGLFTGFSLLASVIGTVTSVLGTIWSVLKSIAGLAFGGVIALFTDIFTILDKSNILENLGSAILMVVEGIALPIKLIVHYLGQILGFGRDMMKQTWAQSITTWLARMSVNIRAAAYNFNQFLSSQKAIEWIDAQYAKLSAQFDRVSQAMANTRDAFKTGGFVVGLQHIANGIRNILKDHPVLLSVFNFLAHILGVIVKGSSAAFGSLKNMFSKLDFSSFTAWLDSLKDLHLFRGALDAISAFFSNIKIDTTGFTNMTTSIGNFFSTMYMGLSGDLNSFKDRVTQLVSAAWQGFLNALQTIRVRDVLKALKLGMVATVMGKIVSAITIFKDVANSVKSVPDAIKGFFVKIGDAVKDIALSFKANMLIKLAVSVGILAGAIWLLATKVPEDKLTHTAVVVGLLAVVMAKLMDSVKSAKILGAGLQSVDIKNFQVIPAIAGSLIGLGILVGAIGSTLFKISKIDAQNKNLKTSIKALLEILGLIGIIFATIAWIATARTFDIGQIQQIGKLFMSFGGSMVLIALSLQMMLIPLAAIGYLSNYIDFGVAIGFILGTLGLIGILAMGLIAVAKGLPSGILAALGPFFLKLAIALKIMINGVIALAVAMIAMGVVEHLLKQAGGNGLGGGFGYVLLTLVTVLVGFSLAFGLLIGAFNKYDDNVIKDIGKTIMKMAGSMLLVALAINMLVLPMILLAAVASKLPVGAMKKAAGAIAVLGAILGIIMAAFAFISADNDVNVKGILAMSAALMLISISILALTPAITAVVTAISGMAIATLNVEGFYEALKKLAWLAIPLIGVGAAIFLVGTGIALFGAGIFAAGAGTLLFAAAVTVLASGIAALQKTLPAFVDCIIELGEKIKNKNMFASFKTGAKWILIFTAAMVALLAIAGLLMSKIAKAETSKFGMTLFDRLQVALLNFMSRLQTYGQRWLVNLTKFLKDNKDTIVGLLVGLIGVIGLYITDLLPTLTSVIADAVVVLIASVADAVSSRSGEFIDSFTKLVTAIFEVLEGVIKNVFSSVFGKDSQLGLLGKILAGIVSALLAFRFITGIFGGIISPFKTLTEVVGGKAGLVGALMKAKTGILALIESAGGLLNIAGPIAIVAAAMAYAAKNVSDQKDILVDRAYGDNERDLEGTAAAIEDTKTRMAQLKEAMDNGATEFSIVQEYDALCITLKNLEDEYEKLIQIRNEEHRGAENAEHDAYIEQKRQERAAKAAAENVYATDGMTEEEVAMLADRQSRVRTEMTETAEVVTESSSVISDAWSKIKEAISTGSIQNDSDLLAMAGNLGLSAEDIMSKVGIDISGFTDRLGEGGSDGGNNFLEGLYGSLGDTGLISMITGSVDTTGTMMVDALRTVLGEHSPSTVAAEAGRYFDYGLAEGVTSKQDIVKGPAVALGATLVNAFNDSARSISYSGPMIISALSSSISAYYSTLSVIGSNMGSSLINGFNSRLGIHSPSRVFAEFAKYIPAGIVQGVTDGEDSAIQSVVILSNSLVDAITATMAHVATVADDSFEFNPVITPVVDMTNLTSAANTANASFGSITSAMRGSIRVSADNAQYAAANIHPDDGNAAVVSEIQLLSSRLDKLGDAVTNMQIVMDTGALVGATSKQMDGAFGTMQARRGRGN